MKEITVKDVAYALQFGHETLVRHPPLSAGRPAKWELQPSGYTVKPTVAQQIAAGGNVYPIETKLNGFQRLAWRAAA